MQYSTESIEYQTSNERAAVPSLWVLNGPHAGDWLSLDPGGLVLGRKPTEQPGRAFDDRKMSRNHCRIVEKSSGIFRCEDLKSKNGTFHNGVPTKGQILNCQDVLRVGSTIFVVGCGAPYLGDYGKLVGASPEMAKVHRLIDLAAGGDLTVLFSGETGTGKEVAAETLHERSGRKGAFVAVNCAAVPGQLIERELFGHVRGAYTGAEKGARGFVEEAQNGTLFLDEIGEMPVAVQSKLLRFLDKREYTPVGSSRARTADVRVVAATNRDLLARIRLGEFREDLYARLEDLVQVMPPLRERKEDLGLLLSAIMQHEFNRSYPMSADFVEAIALYDWPRNVRELKKTIRRIPTLNPGLTEFDVAHLPEEIRAVIHKRKQGVGTMDRDGFMSLVKDHRGNVRQLAEALGKPRATIYRWVEKWQIELDDFRPS